MPRLERVDPAAALQVSPAGEGIPTSDNSKKDKQWTNCSDLTQPGIATIVSADCSRTTPCSGSPLRAALAAEGYAVVTVDSGEAAETLLKHEVVDVVLSDLGLPGMDGAALAACHPGIPFVLITGSAPEHVPEAPLPPSVMARLVKPLDVPHPLVVLRNAVVAAAGPARRSGRDRHRAVNSHQQRGGSGANSGS